MDFWQRRPIVKNLYGIAILALVWIVLAYLIDDIRMMAGLSQIWRQSAVYLALLLSTLLVIRFYDRMPAVWGGIGPHQWMARELGLGMLIGGGIALLAWAPIAMMAGVEKGEGWDGLDIYYMLIPMIISAAGEELLFRGYIFQRVVEMAGPVAATLLTSIIFAFAHIGNPGVTPVALGVIFLGGVFFSFAYLQTGSLWLPIGAHLAWNIVLAKVLGLPVSGMEFGGSLLETTVTGPDFLTGGSFGPEGGAVAIVALVAGIVLLARLPVVVYSPYVYAKVFRAFHAAARRERSTPVP